MSKSTKLDAIVQVAHERGQELKISLGKGKKGDIFQAWPDDHEHIRAMLKRARELRKMAVEMAATKGIDGIQPALNIYSHGHSLVLSAAWLRCYLKGEFKKKK